MRRLLGCRRRLLEEQLPDVRLQPSRGQVYRVLSLALLSCPLRIVGWRDLYYDITLKFDTGSTNAQIVGLQEGVDEEWNLYNVTGRIADPSHSGFVVGGHGVEWVFQIARRFKYYERYFLWPIHILVLFAWTSGPRSPPRLPTSYASWV